MSGAVAAEDVLPESQGKFVVGVPKLEITPSREAVIDGQTVRRALPIRGRRTVGAWCFADHIGPAVVTPSSGLAIGPHPHIGLQTVTWLLSGEILRRDSLGSEQLIRPGQLNLMTAGNGVAHSEESPDGATGDLHGIQLWVAQPDRTRHGAPAFEHHAELPRVEFENAEATVLIGSFHGAVSPARRDTDHVGVDLALHGGRLAIPLQPEFEYAVVVLEGNVEIDQQPITPGHLGYLGADRSELLLSTVTPTRLLLLGGVPFEAPVVMWWNFVGRTHAEMNAATESWQTGDGRFPAVASPLARIPAPPTPWPNE